MRMLQSQNVKRDIVKKVESEGTTGNEIEEEESCATIEKID